jgi:hypothetical protein
MALLIMRLNAITQQEPTRKGLPKIYSIVVCVTVSVVKCCLPVVA